MFNKPINLSIALARAEFKLKNEGSYLGVLWYLLNPLLMFGLLLFIFSRNLGKSIEHYPLYLLLGIIIFNFFRIVTTEATRAIYDNRLIIKSINFSRKALICSIVLKTFFSHLIEMSIFACLLFAFNIPLFNLVFYPIYILCLLIFIFGIALILSAFTIYFMDLENIWNFGSQLLWFATPIFYDVQQNAQLYYLNLLNPLFYFIYIARELFIYGQIPDGFFLFNMIAWSATSLFAGLVVFNGKQNKFAELI